MTLSFPIYRLKRQAKLLARDTKVPLHLALDQIAQREGFRSWAHLSASEAQAPSVSAVFNACQPGEVMLIAARPEQGKTLLALDLLKQATRAGRDAWFFTLEYNEADLQGFDLKGVEIDASDDICADHITRTLQNAKPGGIAVIDYLQLLDRRRDLPPLADQLSQLNNLAQDKQITLIALSQIDRHFDPSCKDLPDLADLRLPNPVDLGLIAKTCFLHDGRAQITAHAA